MDISPAPTLHVNSQASTLIAQCAALLDQIAQEAIQQRGRCTISLCGGSSPQPLFSYWARSSGISWSQVWLFWGDERCVPPNEPESNYRLVAEHLLANLSGTKRPQIFRIHGERPTPSVAATYYHKLLLKLLGRQGQLDLALLGIGTDGHTASIFPQQASIINEQKLWCKATPHPTSFIPRITLTYPPLTQARNRIFFVPDQKKSPILKQMLSQKLQPLKWPAQTLLLLPNTHLFAYPLGS